MSLNIKNEETHQLARELVQLTGRNHDGSGYCRAARAP